jgi:hypothetical protein
MIFLRLIFYICFASFRYANSGPPNNSFNSKPRGNRYQQNNAGNGIGAAGGNNRFANVNEQFGGNGSAIEPMNNGMFQGPMDFANGNGILAQQQPPTNGAGAVVGVVDNGQSYYGNNSHGGRRSGGSNHYSSYGGGNMNRMSNSFGSGGAAGYPPSNPAQNSFYQDNWSRQLAPDDALEK